MTLTMTEEVRRLAPTKPTLNRLFAKSGNQCAFPKCQHEIFLGDTLVAEVCHIEAALKGGKRFNSKQNNEERRQYDNLIILCHKHHKITDDDIIYTVKSLKEMKMVHESLSLTTTSMNEFQYRSMFDDIQNDLNNQLNQVHEKLDHIDKKLDFYGRIRLSRGNIPKEKDFDLFFGKFLNDDVDIAGILLKAQPTLSDCKYAFNNEYYYDIFLFFILFYREKLIDAKDEDKSFDRFNEVLGFEPNKILNSDFGRHKKRLETIFRSNIDLYNITFYGEEKKAIVGFNFWVFINGRWVFFPKPLWAYRKIDKLRTDEDLKDLATIIRTLMKFRIIPKKIMELQEEETLLGMREIMRRVGHQKGKKK